MSIAERLWEYTPEIKEIKTVTDKLFEEYGMLCFKILQLSEYNEEVPYKIIERKIELENKIKKLLYA
jgi:hypothetical protein